MTSNQTPFLSFRILCVLAAFLSGQALSAPATAQDGRPSPTRPASQAKPGEEQAAPGAAQGSRGGAGRKVIEGGPVTGGFKDVSVGDMIEWIASITGKVVIPVQPQTLNTRKITVVIEEPIERSEALDLVFTSFRLNGIGVIETEKVIVIALLDDIRNNPDLPVLDANTDIMSRADRGTMVIKIFRVVNRNADGILDQIEETAPTYASVSVDPDSNSIVVYGDIGYCQQLQSLIDELDNQWVRGKTVTYRLAHADAQEIADNILELFETNTTATPRSPRNARQARNPRQPTQPNVVSTTPGPEIEMRVTVNVQQNTVTVKADPSVIESITRLIDEEWDLPRPETTTKVYRLEYTDPVKIRDTLRELLGTSGGGTSRSTARPTGQPSPGAIGGAGAAPELGNIYRIEAYSDQNSIIVIGKTEASFAFLDDMIAKLDQPSDIGLPLIVELNHADAVELSEELNALLQEAGAGIGLSVEGGGLSGSGMDTGSTGTGGTGGTGTTGTGAVGREAEGARDLQFPWQRARQDEERAPESPLIGTVRIMPIVRQNALAILCPVSQREPIKNWIEFFDRPGRQVMIAAIIAEVELNKDFAFGLRVSSGNITPTNVDNALSGSLTGSASQTPFLDGLFNSSTLDLNFDVNLLLQALSQRTNVRILQEPAVFTADNQEAYFFDGQDVPFIENSNTTDVGGITQSFNYKQVGVVLNVRPRITAQNDVDMEIYLELSSIVPGQTLFGGFIIDRRSTTTEIVVRNGQTIVLSGILRDSESTIVRKVPFIGDIPLVGELFKSRENQATTSELVAFITPVVIENPAAQDELSKENRRLLQELAVPLKDQPDRSEDVRRRMVNPPIIPKLESTPGGLESGRPSEMPDDTPRKRPDGGGGS